MGMYIVLGIMAFMVIGLVLGKWPYGLTAMTCCVALAVSGVMTVQQAFSGFALKNFILLAGMYVVSGAFAKTSLLAVIKEKALKLQGGGKSSFTLYMLLIAVMVCLAQFLPVSAVISLLIVVMSALSSEGEMVPSRLLLPFASMSCMWLGKLPIGIGATGHLVVNQYIQALGSDRLLVITDIIKAALVPLLLVTAYCWFSYKMLPKRAVDISKLEGVQTEGPQLSKGSEIIIYLVFVIVMVSLFLGGLLGDIMYIVPVIGALILVYSKALHPKEARGILSTDMLFMLSGVLIMAEALGMSGAGEALGKGILKILGGNPNYIVILLAFAIVCVVMTQFMSNSGCQLIMQPLAVSTALMAGKDPRGVVLIVIIMCQCAALLPTAAPSVAIAFVTGGYKLKETLLWSVGFIAVALVTTVLSVFLLFPA